MADTGRTGTTLKRCPQCRSDRLERFVADDRFIHRHDGRDHEIVVPDLEQVRCLRCKEVFLDAAAVQRGEEETYRQLALMTPEELSTRREQLGLSQREVHRLLGVGECNLSRWENGRVVQSRSTDTLLRLLYRFPDAVRPLLEHIDADRRRPPDPVPDKERFPNLAGDRAVEESRSRATP